MNFKLASSILSTLCVIIYAVSWYMGLKYEAWVPLLWCFIVATNDWFEYLESK